MGCFPKENSNIGLPKKENQNVIPYIVLTLLFIMAAFIVVIYTGKDSDSEDERSITQNDIKGDGENGEASDEIITTLSETKEDENQNGSTTTRLLEENDLLEAENFGMSEANVKDAETFSESIVETDPGTISDYFGEDYIILNSNVPMFNQYDLDNVVGETYSELDPLGRCGPAFAMIDRSMMPIEERGYIGNIEPTGWHTVKYPELISDLYLYNRCHLIAYALAGENANVLNLITGTRYFNVSSMYQFEKEAIRVLEETDNRVLYRVSPLFVEDELVARGVEMEAYSVEDDGQSLCFHVFCYNIQPGIEIDYLTGDSWVK